MTASSIADELADREQHKNTLIIYNLPEKSNREIDKSSLLSCARPYFLMNLQYPKYVLRLAKRNENKNRPLLVILSYARKF